MAADQQDAADNARYREMRQALADFEAAAASAAAATVAAGQGRGAALPGRDNGGAPAAAAIAPRQRAFYAALRGVLGQCVAEADPGSRRARLAAAHRWFTARRPRELPPDMDAAAAMAASLSVSAACGQQGREGRSAGGQSIGSGGSAAAKGWGKPPPRLQIRGAPGTTSPTRRARDGRAAGGTDAAAAQQCRAAAVGRSSNGRRSASGDASGDADEDEWTDDEGTDDGGAAEKAGHEEAAEAYMAAGRAPLHVPQPSIGRQPAIQREGRRLYGAGSGRGGGGGDGVKVVVAPLLASEPGLMESIALLTGARGGDHASDAALATWARSLSPPPGSAAGAAVQGRGGDDARRREFMCAAFAAQRGFEADVSRRMADYARARARVEEEIMRRQEARRACLGGADGTNGPRPTGASQLKPPQPETEGGDGGTAGGRGGRVLAHVDSQHQPPSTSAYTDARVPGAAERLLAADGALRSLRRRAAAEAEAEVAAAAAALGLGAGAAGVEALARALLPLPDQPHLSCVAALPRPGAGLAPLQGVGQLSRGHHHRKKGAARRKGGGSGRKKSA